MTKSIRTTALFLSFAAVTGSYAQTFTDVNSVIINQPVNDMVFDSAGTGRIIVSIPSSDNIKGNSIGFLDGNTATISAHYFAGSEPGCIALSHNAKYVYAGLNGAGNIKRFNMQTRTIDQTIAIPPTPSGPLFAGDISCSPSADTEIAVSLKDQYRNIQAVNLYRDGIRLSDSINSYASVVVLHHYTSSVLYGFDNMSSGYDFYTMRADDNGIRLINKVGRIFTDDRADFSIVGNMAVSDYGKAVDLSVSPPASLGEFQRMFLWDLGISRGCYDPYQDLWCFASKKIGEDFLYIQRFDARTFLLRDVIRIYNVKSNIAKMVCWGGSTKLAVSTELGQLIIINGTTGSTGIQDAGADAKSLKMVPNPATHTISFDLPETLDITIYTMPGEQVLQARNINQVYIGDLPEAIYIVKIADKEGKLLATRKLIKE
jgi:hypothetical protein